MWQRPPSHSRHHRLRLDVHLLLRRRRSTCPRSPARPPRAPPRARRRRVALADQELLEHVVVAVQQHLGARATSSIVNTAGSALDARLDRAPPPRTRARGVGAATSAIGSSTCMTRPPIGDQRRLIVLDQRDRVRARDVRGGDDHDAATSRTPGSRSIASSTPCATSTAHGRAVPRARQRRGRRGSARGP